MVRHATDGTEPVRLRRQSRKKDSNELKKLHYRFEKVKVCYNGYCIGQLKRVEDPGGPAVNDHETIRIRMRDAILPSWS